MEKVLQMCRKTNDNQIKEKSQFKSLNKSIDFITNKSGKYEQERQEKHEFIDGMKIDMVNSNKNIEKLEEIVDRQGQYICWNCLLLHGIAKVECENTDDLVL